MIECSFMDVISDTVIWDSELLEEINESKITEEVIVKYASLMYKTPLHILKEDLFRMHFKNIDIKSILELATFKQANNDISNYSEKDFKNAFFPLWIGERKIKDFVAITIAQKYKNFESLYKVLDNAPPIFPINGDDLIQKGLTGQDIGNAINKLKLLWIQKEFDITKQELLEQL